MTDESPLELVERLGPAAERDPEARRLAVQQPLELSDGGLTRLGAADALANHRTLRRQLEGLRRDAATGLEAYGL